MTTRIVAPDLPPPVSPLIYVLSKQDYLEAERTWRRFKRDALNASDLAAEIDYWIRERALWLGDLTAGDFSEHDEATLRGGIAYAEQRLSELVRPAVREARALRQPSYLPARPASDLAPRFAAAKWADLVGLAETLTAHSATRAGNGRFRIACPFHGGDREPSLVIYPPPKGWYCFGCAKGGDPVAFVAELQRCSAVEALAMVEHLADLPGAA